MDSPISKNDAIETEVLNESNSGVSYVLKNIVNCSSPVPKRLESPRGKGEVTLEVINKKIEEATERRKSLKTAIQLNNKEHVEKVKEVVVKQKEALDVKLKQHVHTHTTKMQKAEENYAKELESRVEKCMVEERKVQLAQERIKGRKSDVTCENEENVEA